MTTQNVVSKFSKLARLTHDHRDSLTREEKVKLVKKIAAVALIGAVAITSLTLCILYGKPLFEFVSDTERFRAWLDARGALAPLLFIAVRAFQTVIKIIPAEPLEIGAGYAFGTWLGCLYCMIGTLIGSLIIIGFTRKLGMKMVHLFVPQKKLESLKFLQQAEKISALLFVIYLIPATPKDVITYLIGVLPISVPSFMVLTTIARFPAIISSTICGSALGDRNWWLVIGVYAATVILGAVGMYFYKRWTAKKCPTPGEAGTLEEQI